MEQIRIDRRGLASRRRSRDARESRAKEAAAPLAYTAPGGPDVDDDLLARIDVVLGDRPAEDDLAA